MANRITGLKNLYIAEKTAENTYAQPVRLVGAKAVKVSGEASEVAFYSDNVMDVYESALSALGLEIELAYITPEIESLLTGKEINTVGAMVTGANDKQKTVAFMYEMSTLEQPIRRVIYECILTKNDSEASTQTDKKEEFTIKLVGKAKSREVDGKFELLMDANNIPTGTEVEFKKAFDGFFNGVILPDGTVSPAPARSK